MPQRRWTTPLKSWWVRIAIFIALWITAFSIDYDYDRRTHITDRVSVVEHVHAERHPFAAMAENFHFFFLPIPISFDRVSDRRLERDGVPVPRIMERGHWLFAASPDQRYVLLWSGAEDPAWRVLEVASGRVDTLAMPKSLHASTQPSETGNYLDFRGWSDDSRHLTAMIIGSDYSATTHGDGHWRDLVNSYRELWTIDVPSGTGRRTQRCEFPSGSNADWENTPCAGARPIYMVYGGDF